MTRQDEFRQLHASGCFVMPNPWDVGSAVALEQMGFKALATTSSGHAWTMARADNHVTRDEMLEHLREICAAVGVPVNADFEGGYADHPDDFRALLEILDGELRLITPAEPDATAPDAEGPGRSPEAGSYQLTHDFLIPSLRAWLARRYGTPSPKSLARLQTGPTERRPAA